MKSIFGRMCLLGVLIMAISLFSLSQNLDVKAPADLSSRNRDAIEVTRDQVRTDRKALVKKAMKLTDDEAQAFWPLYDDYTSELTKINDRTVSLITNFADNYRDLSDPEVLRMAAESLRFEQEKLAVKQRYAKRFGTVLPGKKSRASFK